MNWPRVQFSSLKAIASAHAGQWLPLSLITGQNFEKLNPMKSFFLKIGILLPMLLAAGNLSATTVWLNDLDVDATIQDWGNPHKNQSVDGHTLSIGGIHYVHGLGTHARSTLFIDLAGSAEKFSASVGVDDEVSPNVGSIDFQVIGDGNVLWDSGVMRVGDRAKSVEVNLHGMKTLELVVNPDKDDISYDHADWADAKFEATDKPPVAMSAPHEDAVILTPPSPSTPRINGAKIFGVRPHDPFLFTIAATGDRPMTFSAKHLPSGLKLDKTTGRITGQLDKEGIYEVTLGAKNARGAAQEKFKIVCGPQIALTPPMGWNSWNCFAGAVSADKVRAAANAMIKSGLANHGWTYINIDDYWQTHKDSTDPTLQGPRRDAQGRILANPRFPDMKGLAEYVHGLGLKIGLYSSPGPWTCGGCVGSFDHEQQDAQQYADWGFDYLKYDWCSYRPELEQQRGQSTNYLKLPTWSGSVPSDLAQLMQPYQVMDDALRRQHRCIVFSLCQYGMGDVWKWGAQVGGNLWRTTGDITDTWGSMCANGFSSVGREPYAGPGHWNDPDMLVVGRLGWGSLRPTRLTPNEQYTHISLWCLLASPLLIGCDMSQLDDFTISLLSNDEVLAVDQDPLGKQASPVAKAGSSEIWAKDMEDGSKAVGLFNRGEAATQVTVNWASLGLQGSSQHRVRDLWRQQDLGNFSDSFTTTVPRHGVVLIRVW
jgi:alpha-galactosidase